MLKLLKSICLIIFLLFFYFSFVFAAEEITITTYYPSPYGSYDSLQTDKLGVGDTNGDGSLTSADVPTTSGDVWIKGTVAVGTMVPQSYSALEVNTSANKSIYTMDSVNGGLLIGYNGSTIQARTIAHANTQNLLLQRWGGSVGIGLSTAPAQKLHVAGDIMGAAPDGTNTWYLDRVAGADPWVRLFQGSGAYNSFAVGPFYANGASRFDLAEVTPVRKEEALEVGDVVCIDKEAKVRMRRSQKAYDPLVSGIISDPKTASMIIGGGTPPEKINSIKDKKPIALVGRVLCKVSTENGPIEIGDLLVTSNKPGYAMKASMDKLKPGMVLGKAMESLKDGTGKIIVWVTSQ